MSLWANCFAKISVISAFKWNPARVMNYQQYPSFAKAGINSLIYWSDNPDASQLKEGDKLYESIKLGFSENIP